MTLRPRPAAASIAALIALAVPSWGCGAGDERATGASPSISLSGVHPSFDPGSERYVSRCGRGAEPIRVDAGRGTRVAVESAAPRTGEFSVRPQALPGEDFELVAIEPERRREYQVRCLPADFPAWRFERLRPSAPGLFAVAFRAAREARPWVIVFDHTGAPRWWYSPPTRALWAQILDHGTIVWARSFGDGYGSDPRMAYEVRSLSGSLLRLVRTKGSIIDGHEFEPLDNGNVLVDSYDPGGRVDLEPFGGPARTSAVFAEIQELDPRGRVLWRWNSRRRIALEETGRWWRNVLSNAKPGPAGGTVFDPVHINSIDPRGSDEVVISARHTDAVYGIDRSDGEIRWKLGGTETADSLRVVGDPARKLLGGQHDARIGAGGILTVYDNGKDRPRDPRVASYRLDLERGTATFLGQLNDSRVEESHCCGSARPLAGGGWLVSWGDNPLVTGFDDDDELSFRLELPVSSFRAVPVPPGAASIAELDRGMEAMER
ncbi:MAG: arylsulfotransferase family protein [Solirubrobacterales bacterium]